MQNVCKKPLSDSLDTKDCYLIACRFIFMMYTNSLLTYGQPRTHKGTHIIE